MVKLKLGPQRDRKVMRKPPTLVTRITHKEVKGHSNVLFAGDKLVFSVEFSEEVRFKRERVVGSADNFSAIIYNSEYDGVKTRAHVIEPHDSRYSEIDGLTGYCKTKILWFEYQVEDLAHGKQEFRLDSFGRKVLKTNHTRLWFCPSISEFENKPHTLPSGREVKTVFSDRGDPFSIFTPMPIGNSRKENAVKKNRQSNGEADSDHYIVCVARDLSEGELDDFMGRLNQFGATEVRELATDYKGRVMFKIMFEEEDNVSGFMSNIEQDPIQLGATGATLAVENPKATLQTLAEHEKRLSEHLAIPFSYSTFVADINPLARNDTGFEGLLNQKRNGATHIEIDDAITVTNGLENQISGTLQERKNDGAAEWLIVKDDGGDTIIVFPDDVAMPEDAPPEPTDWVRARESPDDVFREGAIIGTVGTDEYEIAWDSGEQSSVVSRSNIDTSSFIGQCMKIPSFKTDMKIIRDHAKYYDLNEVTQTNDLTYYAADEEYSPDDRVEYRKADGSKAYGIVVKSLGSGNWLAELSNEHRSASQAHVDDLTGRLSFSRNGPSDSRILKDPESWAMRIAVNDLGTDYVAFYDGNGLKYRERNSPPGAESQTEDPEPEAVSAANEPRVVIQGENDDPPVTLSVVRTGEDGEHIVKKEKTLNYSGSNPSEFPGASIVEFNEYIRSRGYTDPHATASGRPVLVPNTLEDGNWKARETLGTYVYDARRNCYIKFKEVAEAELNSIQEEIRSMTKKLDIQSPLVVICAKKSGSPLIVGDRVSLSKEVFEDPEDAIFREAFNIAYEAARSKQNGVELLLRTGSSDELWNAYKDSDKKAFVRSHFPLNSGDSRVIGSTQNGNLQISTGGAVKEMKQDLLVPELKPISAAQAFALEMKTFSSGVKGFSNSRKDIIRAINENSSIEGNTEKLSNNLKRSSQFASDRLRAVAKLAPDAYQEMLTQEIGDFQAFLEEDIIEGTQDNIGEITDGVSDCVSFGKKIKDTRGQVLLDETVIEWNTIVEGGITDFETRALWENCYSAVTEFDPKNPKSLLRFVDCPLDVAIVVYDTSAALNESVDDIKDKLTGGLHAKIKNAKTHYKRKTKEFLVKKGGQVVSAIFGEEAGEVAAGCFEFASSFADDAEEMVGGFIDDIRTGNLIDAGPKLASRLIDKAGEKFNKLLELGGRVWETTKKLMTNVGKKIEEGFNKFNEAMAKGDVGGALAGVAGGAAEAVAQVATATAEAVSNAVQGVADAVSNTARAVGDKVTEAGEAIGTWTKGAVDDIGKGFNDAGRATSEAFSSAGNAIGGWFSGLGGGLSSGSSSGSVFSTGFDWFRSSAIETGLSMRDFDTERVIGFGGLINVGISDSQGVGLELVSGGLSNGSPVYTNLQGTVLDDSAVGRVINVIGNPLGFLSDVVAADFAMPSAIIGLGKPVTVRATGGGTVSEQEAKSLADTMMARGGLGFATLGIANSIVDPFGDNTEGFNPLAIVPSAFSSAIGSVAEGDLLGGMKEIGEMAGNTIISTVSGGLGGLSIASLGDFGLGGAFTPVGRTISLFQEDLNLEIARAEEAERLAEEAKRLAEEAAEEAARVATAAAKAVEHVVTTVAEDTKEFFEDAFSAIGGWFF